MKQDIIALRKILNSRLFSEKYPVIDRVDVDEYGNGIDIVLIPNNSDEYWSVKDEIRNYIYTIIRLASINNWPIRIYP